MGKLPGQGNTPEQLWKVIQIIRLFVGKGADISSQQIMLMILRINVSLLRQIYSLAVVTSDHGGGHVHASPCKYTAYICGLLYLWRNGRIVLVGVCILYWMMPTAGVARQGFNPVRMSEIDLNILDTNQLWPVLLLIFILPLAVIHIYSIK